MRASHAFLAALVGAVTLVAIASAGPAATKQRVAIDAKIRYKHTFVLTPFRTGPLKPDSGVFLGAGSRSEKSLLRNGQHVKVSTNTWELGGKRGTLTIREQIEWVEIGSDANGDGDDDIVAVGTWKVVRGNGQYAGVTGGGGCGHVGLGSVWNARYEGFLTAR